MTDIGEGRLLRSGSRGEEVGGAGPILKSGGTGGEVQTSFGILLSESAICIASLHGECLFCHGVGFYV